MKRWMLIGIVAAGIVLILVGNFSWNKKVEKTVQEAEERINSPIYKESLGKTLGSIEKENEGTNGTTSSTEKDTETKTTKESETTTEEQEATSPNENTTPSLQEIKDEYYVIFSELEAQETSKVDQLIVEAKADYVGNKVPLSQLISKYQEAATLLEQNADRTFNTIYQQLEIDLERYGYSKENAVEFRQAYNAKKSARSTRILSQIQSF